MDVEGLRVLAFCDWFDQSNGGGAERVAFEVWRRMAAAGADITVLAVEPRGAYGEEQREGLRVVRIPGRDLTGVVPGPFILGSHLVSRARRVAATIKPDVLHATGLHLASSVAAAWVSRRCQVPLVVSAHLAGTDSLPLSTRLPAAAYERTVGRWILRRADRVIAVSLPVERHLVSLGVPAEKIDLAPNGVDADFFRPSGSEPDKPPLILFVGRLVANKGPDMFVDTLAVLRDRGTLFSAVVVGDGPLRARAEQRARDASVDDQLRFVGHVGHDAVATWLERATLLMRPSTTEGRPLGLLEAMAAGVCVIATDIDPNRDVIIDGQTGLLAKLDANSFADAAARVLTDPAYRAGLVANARAAVEPASWDAATAASAASLLSAARPR